VRILAFDTSTDACSVALCVDGERLVDHAVVPRAHAQRLLPGIRRLLAEAQLSPGQLDALVYGRGPGSFTGVRIAVSAAQGFAWGADIGTLGVSTLAAIAQGCLREHGDADVLAMLDARMGELYLGRYRDGGDGLMTPDGAERAIAPARAGIGGLPVGAVLAGSGAEALGDVDPGERLLRAGQLPHALDLLDLAAPAVRAGQLQDPALAQPAYLRDKVALTEAERGIDSSLGAMRS